jgi:DNA-binding transcriptional ArsR family regulator
MTMAVYPVGTMNPRRDSAAAGADGARPAPRTIDAAQVALVRSAMPSDGDVVDLADVFGLLGEPSRVRILIALLNGRMSVRDLAASISLSESAVSHALRLLRAHRVVDVHREGRVAYYALADSHVRVLLELGLEHVGHTMLVHPAPNPDQVSGPACDRSN